MSFGTEAESPKIINVFTSRPCRIRPSICIWTNGKALEHCTPLYKIPHRQTSTLHLQESPSKIGNKHFQVINLITQERFQKMSANVTVSVDHDCFSIGAAEIL